MIRKMGLLVMLLTGALMETWAQEGLNVSELFDGRYKRKDNAIEVVVKGESIERYGLELFRSLTVKNVPKEFDRIEKLVEADAAMAVSKETGRIGERLYYGFYCLPPKKKLLYRYLFFRNSSLRKVENNELTLIYMEGHVTMEELKKMFKK